jgi:hypothetical protein
MKKDELDLMTIFQEDEENNTIEYMTLGRKEICRMKKGIWKLFMKTFDIC